MEFGTDSANEKHIEHRECNAYNNIEEPARCNNNNLLIYKINKLLLLHLVGSSVLLYLR